MSTLTEGEIYSRLQSAIGEARDACKNLAVRSIDGRDYSSLRDSLMLIEGCCRQMAVFRGDYRWLPVGVQIAECHKQAGGWLRGYYDHGVHVKWEAGQMNKMFVVLGKVLEQLGEMATKFKNERTNVIGAILPPSMTTERETRREGRPAFALPKAKQRPGLILPAKYQKAG